MQWHELVPYARCCIAFARSLCETSRCAFCQHDDVASRVPSHHVASHSSSARCSWFLCSVINQSTSRLLDNVDWHYFPQRNTSPNIYCQLIYFHDVGGWTNTFGTRCRSELTPVRVIAGSRHQLLQDASGLTPTTCRPRFFFDYSVFLRNSRHLGRAWHFSNHFWF